MIDFTDAPKLKKGYGGANGNKISILLNGSRWMLKFPSISERSPELHYTKGCISEYIGSHIFQSTGISAQDTLLGTYFINGSEKTVVACRDFVEPGFELQDFASLKNQMVDSARSGYGTELKDILETFNVQDVIDPEELENHFWNMFIVDSLIGNWDRHNGNWGFLYDSTHDALSIAPVYDCGSSLFPEAGKAMQKDILHNKQALHRRLYSIPTSSIKINGRRINYFNFLSSLENDGCNRALERMLPRIDMSKINNIIGDTPGIDQAEKEFYTGIIKARKEAILDYSADLLSREKGIVILTKEFKRMPDRSLASKDISSTEAAKKLAEAKNSRASKDETLNKLNIKAVEDSHLDDSSNTSCL